MASSTQRKLLQGEPYDPRRVVVVIGDGHDNASTHTLQEALELAQRNLVTVYCMDTEYYSFDNQYRGNLTLLADETGGKMEEPLQNVYKDVSGFLTQPRDEGNYQLKPGTGAYTAQIAKALDRAIVSIAGEVSQQYILRYTPDIGDDPREKRSIDVKVGVPNVIVNARNYYYPYPVPQ